MRPYIEFKNVVKQFGNFTALDHVSLEIPKGAFVTLLGPSGCGKTTLMRQLAGFSEPESGDVLVDGKRMNGLPPFKRNTPLVFQEYALFPHMTVYENISYGLKLNKTPKEEMNRRVQEMLKMFNLVGLEKRFPKEMSGGQQQRVAFARARRSCFWTNPFPTWMPSCVWTSARNCGRSSRSWASPLSMLPMTRMRHSPCPTSLRSCAADTSSRSALLGRSISGLPTALWQISWARSIS